MKVYVLPIRDLSKLLDEEMKNEINESIKDSGKLIEHIVQNECYIRDKECKAINKVLERWNLNVRVERCKNCVEGNRLKKPFLRESGNFWRKCVNCRLQENLNTDCDEEKV
jgi:hypothetical protein